MAVGRISGPLLKSNLIRNGIDLAFETDLLYLDVNNQRIGVKTNAPQHELDVNGTTRTTNLIVTTQADIGDITITDSTISTNNPTLNLATIDTVVSLNRLRVDSIEIEGNAINANNLDSSADVDIELRPHGAGAVNIHSDMNVDGNIHATGNITADGNITIGDADTDSITINAEVASNIIPNADVTYELGTGGTQYDEGVDFTLGDATLTVSSGSGTLSIPAAGPTWVDNLTSKGSGSTFVIVIDAFPDSVYDITTTAAWTGTSPQTVTVNAASIADGTYNLTRINVDAKRWNDVWVNTLVASAITSSDLSVDGIDLTFRNGNIYYVAENGDDTNSGDHILDPYASIGKALQSAQSGDTVFINPGVYTEAFPLTVPQGVTVKGQSIRGVNIQPTSATRYNDAFLLNGETTVEDITVSGFYSGGNFYETTAASAGSATINVGTTSFAHTYVSGGTINISSTDYAITNATYDHTTGVVVITHTGPDAGVGTTIFIKDLTFSCNGGTRTFPDNGYAFRFATDFEVTTRSPYIKNVTVITEGSTTNPTLDPRGFDAGDAGKGAYVDGAYATTSSVEAAMLFHSVTFITPGVDALTVTNGARVEWLNSFTYFANRSVYAFDSNDGLYGTGQTRIRLGGVTGTFTAGDTVTFTSTDASTVINVSVDDVDGDILIIDGKNTDLLDFDFTPQSITAAPSGASATSIENLDLQDFGAEIRMIASASVYGNYGLYGDGAGVLVYAIGHNLAYIGVGKEQTNDNEAVIQDNEVIEVNDAKIRYNSVDHQGDFRVGDLFYVDQQTGNVSFNAANFTINTEGGLTITDGSNTTYISATTIDTGNLSIHDNTIESTSGPINIEAFNNEVNFDSNVNIDGDLDVTGNITLGGNITIGDEVSDTIQIVAGIDSNIVPALDSVYSLGTQLLRWSNLYINQITADSIEIRDNYITTTESNANLELRANGTGEILVPSNDVQIDNNLTVSGDTDLQDTTITGTVTHVGDLNQTGNTTVTGNVTVTQDLDVTGAAQFEEILVDDNYITTTTSNSDLELRASGTGEVLIPNNNLNVTNDVFVTGDISSNNLTTTGTITSNTFTTGDIVIDDNYIETTTSNSDLELRANGTGEILVPSNDVQINNDLTVSGATDIQSVTVTGTITHTGNVTHTGNFDIAGTFTNGNISVSGNVIETLDSNSDLELRANGTGEILVPNNNVQIDNDLTVSGDTDLQGTTVTGDISHTGNVQQTGNITLTGNLDVTGTVTISSTTQFEDVQIANNVITTTESNSDLELRANGTGDIIVPNNDVTITNDLTVVGTISVNDITSLGTITANRFSTGDILIDDNFITTTTSNSDLELRANGTGEILVPSNDVTFEQDLTVNGSTTLTDTTVNGTITHVGNVDQTGNLDVTGSVQVTGQVTVSGTTQLEDIQVNDNVITTTTSNSDLELRANGTGQIVVPNNDVNITNNLAIGGTLTVGDVVSVGLIQANRFTTGDILVDDNYITTTTSNSDLELRANGTGSIVIDTFDINTATISTSGDFTIQPGNGVLAIDGVGSVKLPVGGTGDRPTADAGQIRFNSDLSRFEGYNGSNWIQLNGVQDVDGNTKITAELTEGANDNIIRFYVDGSVVADINDSRLDTGRVTVDDIQVDGNVISTVTADTDLELSANGTGSVVFENFAFKDNKITNTASGAITTFEVTGNGYFEFTDPYGVVLPVGGNATRPTGVTGMVRYNTDDERVELYDGTSWVSVAGASGGISFADAENIAIEKVLIFG